jgi:hypothetical protein
MARASAHCAQSQSARVLRAHLCNVDRPMEPLTLLAVHRDVQSGTLNLVLIRKVEPWALPDQLHTPVL